MSSFPRSIAMSALLGAAILAGPLTAMAADSTSPVATQAAPAVVYGRPENYPPPVVYGPAVGIVLPGISIGIQ